jgi:23S rRNA (cytidine1920-2'-O)/16S rRNA (cytidine1409-2'-O)-methyltransferase
VRRGLVPSRSAARRAIDEHRVAVGGIPHPGPATLVDPSAEVHLIEPGSPWVSRGGDKLAGALQTFALDVAGARALDVGASTGGFTDVLLAGGAASVTALDVGYGQIAWRLRTDPRVTVVDRTNFRHVDPSAIGSPFDVVVADVSFISLRLLVEQLRACGHGGTEYVLLVKPQFEVGRGEVGKGGVVGDPALHAAAIRSVADALTGVGLGSVDVVAAPITGEKGNQEFFLHARPGDTRLTKRSVEEVVRE